MKLLLSFLSHVRVDLPPHEKKSQNFITNNDYINSSFLQIIKILHT